MNLQVRAPEGREHVAGAESEGEVGEAKQPDLRNRAWVEGFKV